jgi:two-component system sensor histidine kinase PilS (NtrC family)
VTEPSGTPTTPIGPAQHDGTGPAPAVHLPGAASPHTVFAPRLSRSLRWLIAIRLVVITSVVLPYLLSQLASPTELPTFDFLFLLAGVTYLASLFYIALLRLLRTRPVVQAYIQFSGDLLLVTGLVYFFGGIGSPFSLFYLVVIMVASVVLRRRAGLIVATSAYILYGGLMTGLARGRIPPVRPALSEAEIAWRLPYNLAVHLFGFYAIALLTSYLAENVRRAEAELEEKRDDLANLEAFHRDIVQSLSTGIVTTDLDGTITSLNRAALEMLDRPQNELLARPISALGLISIDKWRRLAEIADSEGHSTRGESKVVREERGVPIGYSLSCLSDAAGVPSGTILIFQDLTRWRNLEEELRLKDRMAAVGELAAGIAHEVGNPMAAISGSVQLLSHASPESGSQSKLLEIILRESQRLDRTIKGFLRFARPRDRATASFDIAGLLSENTELLRNSEEATGRHRLELDLDPPTAQMVGDRDQISQIFWNLAQNALRAMPDGGTLTVRGRLNPELYRMEFRDTGMGMTESQRTRLFQPFQTFFGGGSGIGLAIVYRIVQEHGGRVEVESAPAEGTSIAVELPLSFAPEAATVEA